MDRPVNILLHVTDHNMLAADAAGGIDASFTKQVGKSVDLRLQGGVILPWVTAVGIR